MNNWLEITSVVPCSLNCSYCPQKKLAQSYRHSTSIDILTFDNYKKYLATVPANVLISFAGFSEPFLSKDMVKIMKWTHEKGHEMNLYTTFVGADINTLHSIKELPFDEITVHLPWKYLAKPESIPQTYLEILKEAGLCFKNKKLKFVHFEPIPDSVQTVIEGFEVENGILIDRAGNIDQINLNTKKSGNISCGCCGKNFNNNVLLPDGRVVLCCMDFSLNHVIGDLSKMSYDDLFKSKEFRKCKKGSVDETIPLLCRKCNKAVIDEEYKYPFNLKLKFKLYQIFGKSD